VTPLVGGAGVTYSDDAEGSVFSSIVKGAAKEVLPNTIKKLDDIKSKYSNVDLDVYETSKGLILSKVVVPKDVRSEGIGSNLMKDLIKYADENNKPIALTPDNTFGGSKTRLKSFYKNFGFKENKGRNKDFSFTETMVRQPQNNKDNVMQVDSLKQSNNQAGKDFDAANARYFEDGNYQAPTAENPISIIKPTETKPGIIAFHGSGADFNEFKLSKIGTGEGNQAFGYGLYFTDSKDIAKFYKDTVTYQNQVRKRLNLEYKGEKFVDLGDTAAAENASSEYRVITKLKEDIASYLPANPKLATVQEAKNRLLKRLDVEIDKYSKAGQKDSDLGTIELADGSKLEDLILESLQNEKDTLLKININDIKIVSGKTYEVNIKTVTDDLLDNDLPLNQQSKSIQEKINSLNLDFIKTDMTGDDIYDFIAVKKFKLGDNLLDRTYQKYDDKSVSELLNSVGIKGIKLKAGQLTPGQDTSSATNYVIFDDKIIDIMKKYGIVGAVGVTAANSNEAESNT